MTIKTLREAENKLISLIQMVKNNADRNLIYKYQGTNDLIAKQLHIEIVEQTLTGEYAFYLSTSPVTGKPTITIDPNGSDQERLNFTYFHEVTHHIIRSDDELYGFIDEIAVQNEGLVNLREQLANIGAAEFLLPGIHVKESIDKDGFSIDLLRELDQKYPISKPAITIQLARYASHKCFVIICEFGLIPAKDMGQETLIGDKKQSNNACLHVRYSASSPSNKYSIATFVPIPKLHLLSDIYENQLSIKKGKDLIPFRSGREWSAFCEGIFYKGKVYAVFNVESPRPSVSLQPELFTL